MGAPKGNQFAKGNRGGSRKSAYQERADAIMLEKMFMDEMSKEEVQKKLASGKYSLKEVFVSKAFAGNERMLLAMFNKLFPDKTDVDLRIGRKSVDSLKNQDMDKLMDVFNDNETQNRTAEESDNS